MKILIKISDGELLENMSVFVCASNSEPYSCSSEANFKWLCTKGSTLSRSVSLDQQIHRRRSVVLEVKVVLLLKRNLSVGISRRSTTRSKKKEEVVTTTE